MEQSEMMSGEAKEALSGEVMDSLGDPDNTSESHQETLAEKDTKDELPKAAKERLGRQEKRHQKELRSMQAQIQDLHNRMGSQTMQSQNQPANGYQSQPSIMPEGGSIEDHIHKAVNAALQAKDQRELEMKQQASQAHVQKQYQDLDQDLDRGSEKYDDFDDVVRGHDVPFTAAMRDTALLLPNRADVLYKLAKNKPELERIKDLHPLDQAKEMVKLSHALQGGMKEGASAPRQLGDIKSMPVSAPGSVNENTSVGELRRKLKAGWK